MITTSNIFGQTDDSSTHSLSASVVKFIHSRQQIIEQSAAVMDRPRGLIDLIFSFNAGVAENLRHSTREVISGILMQLPPQMKAIWQDCYRNPTDTNELLKTFCWAFKSLTYVNSDRGVAIKDRSSGIPYAVHTHVDVPFAIATVLGKNPDPLTLAVACSHDTKEEGQFVQWDEVNNRAIFCEFDAAKLINLLPDNQLAKRLMISIPTLTESTWEEMQPHLDIAGYEHSINSILSNIDKPTTDDLKLNKFFVKHPFVFGGLAVQIKSVVESLLTGNEKDEELAYSIVMTEIGDRISDVSSLEYYFNYKSEFGAEAAHERVLCFYSRIHNMMHKLQLTQHLFSTDEMRKSIHKGIGFLKDLLDFKINELQTFAEEEPLSIFTPSEINEHQQMMEVIQGIADGYMQAFLEKKVASILEGSI